jgi:hypothetical protein
MTEAKAEGNILNSTRYPDIKDDTLSFVLPCEDQAAEVALLTQLRFAISDSEFNPLNIFRIKHWLNGWYLVIQSPLR